jgi:hypothetical protein
LKKEVENPIIGNSPMISYYEVPPDVAGRIPNIVMKIDQ